MKPSHLTVQALLVCVVGYFSETSLVQVVYSPMKSTMEKCQESAINNNPQLSKILREISSQLPPLPIENCGNILETLFASSPQVEAAYYNETYFVQMFQALTMNDCSSSQKIPNDLLDLLATMTYKTMTCETMTCETMTYKTMTCKTIYQMHPSFPSGNYIIKANNGSLVEAYCDMEGDNCGGEGGWMRVIHLDMTQPGSQCPQGLKPHTYESVQNRTFCGRTTTKNECDGTPVLIHNINYTRICGKVRGYQYGHTEAFHDYWDHDEKTIEDQYVYGVSITHGTPRSHIWTFAASIAQDAPIDLFPTSVCPCDTDNNGEYGEAPPFVGDDYYCESGTNTSTLGLKLFPEDPLWDGEKCRGFEGPCCTRPNLPWFIKTLDQPTGDNIELRICIRATSSISHADVVIDQVEIYVQ